MTRSRSSTSIANLAITIALLALMACLAWSERQPAPRGCYTEWVVRTAGLRRLVTGQKGEAFYTPDHYETFIRVREPS